MIPDCDFERADHLAKPHYPDGAWKCVKCGRVMPFDAKGRCPKFGWGDRVKQLTNLIGIKQCGKCKKRQKLLNRLGRR